MGTSPISSIPYTLSLGYPLSLGMFTLIFSLLLIVIQLILMRKNFPQTVLAADSGLGAVLLFY